MGFHSYGDCLTVNMSIRAIEKVGNFLKLLLNTTQKQARALFYTLTPIQTAALCEIFFNLPKLPLASNVLRELGKRKFLIKKLTDKHTKTRDKLELIQRHYRQIYHTLELIKQELLSVLE